MLDELIEEFKKECSGSSGISEDAPF